MCCSGQHKEGLLDVGFTVGINVNLLVTVSDVGETLGVILEIRVGEALACDDIGRRDGEYDASIL